MSPCRQLWCSFSRLVPLASWGAVWQTLTNCCCGFLCYISAIAGSWRPAYSWRKRLGAGWRPWNQKTLRRSIFSSHIGSISRPVREESAGIVWTFPHPLYYQTAWTFLHPLYYQTVWWVDRCIFSEWTLAKRQKNAFGMCVEGHLGSFLLNEREQHTWLSS